VYVHSALQEYSATRRIPAKCNVWQRHRLITI
jgi:hypothetical protein